MAKKLSDIQFPIDGEYGKDWKITSPFGWRVDPLGRAPKKHHNAVDLVGIKNPSPYIEAFYKGTVLFAGPSKRRKEDGSVGGFGYHVIIRHLINGEFYTSCYAHNIPTSLKVKKGQKVEAGTVLAKLGNSGDSTGPHCHFEIWKGKTHGWSADGVGFVNPIEFIKALKAAKRMMDSAADKTPDDDVVNPVPVHDAKPEPKPVAAKKVVKKPKA